MKTNRSKIFSLTTLLSLFIVPTAFATTFVVNTTDDQNLGPCSAAHCSLREAIIAANTNVGPDSIVFNINRATDPNCTVAAGDVDKICKIKVVGTALPTVIDSVTIDGQIPEGRPNIPGSVSNPTVYATLRPGIEVSGELLPTTLAAPAAGIRLLNVNNATIKGLVINRIPGIGLLINASSNVTVIGNYIGTDVTATLPSVWNATYTTCTANCFGNRTGGGNGMIVNGNNIRIGGKAVNERNVVANNQNPGISLTEANDSAVVGNFTGTDVYGLAAMGNRVENIEIRGFTGTTRPLVGLPFPPSVGVGSNNNKLDGNICLDSKTRASMRLLGRTALFKVDANDPGTLVTDTIKNTVIVNNLIGVNLAGAAKPNLMQAAMSINDSVQDSKIGFEVVNGVRVPGPNTIANNPTGGIVLNNDTVPVVVAGVNIGNSTTVFTQTFGNAMLYNKIYDTPATPVGGIGIDLTFPINVFTGDSVTLNDSHGHTDSVPNRMQNFPVLDPVKSFINPSLVQTWGSLDSAPNKKYLIQIFSNTVPNATGYGDGKVFNGELEVLTDGNGHVDFHIPAKVGVAAGNIITATATDLATGDTSEFSQAIDIVKHGSATAYLNANGAAGGDKPVPDPQEPF